MYNLRTKDGLLVAKVSNNLANSLIKSGMAIKKNDEESCYYSISEDIKLEVAGNHGLIDLFLWEGYKLTKIE